MIIHSVTTWTDRYFMLSCVINYITEVEVYNTESTVDWYPYKTAYSFNKLGFYNEQSMCEYIKRRV